MRRRCRTVLRVPTLGEVWLDRLLRIIAGPGDD
jgi:hypothetical protein